MKMATYYHGATRRRSSFEGWYLKHQTQSGRALSLIPALHIDAEGRRTASLQVITENACWWLEYPELLAEERRFRIQLGENLFDSGGVRLQIRQQELTLTGSLSYGRFTPLRSDIMGPFRLLGGMECAHGIISMGHSLHGTLVLNGEMLDFSQGTGYIETDRGRSFPSTYLWAQSIWQDGGTSLMLAVAAIPMGVGGFTGCICVLCHGGREYRLATYRGVQIERWSSSGAMLRQGRYRLAVDVLEGKGHPLRAPVQGEMSRTIHESLGAVLRVRFWIGKELVLDHTDHHAGFEYAVTASKG